VGQFCEHKWVNFGERQSPVKLSAVDMADLKLFTRKQSPISWFVTSVRIILDHPLSAQDVYIVDTPGTNDTAWNDERTMNVLRNAQSRAFILVLKENEGLKQSGKEFLRELLFKGVNAFDRLIVVINFGFDKEAVPSLESANKSLKPFVREQLEEAFEDLRLENSGPDVEVAEQALERLRQDNAYFCVNAKAACGETLHEKKEGSHLFSDVRSLWRRNAASTGAHTGFPEFRNYLDRILSTDEARRGFMASAEDGLAATRDALIGLVESGIASANQREDQEKMVKRIEILQSQLTRKKEKLELSMTDLQAVFKTRRDELRRAILEDFAMAIRLCQAIEKAVSDCWKLGEVSFLKIVKATARDKFYLAELAADPAVKALSERLTKYTEPIIRSHTENCRQAFEKGLKEAIDEAAHEFSRSISSPELPQANIENEFTKIVGEIAANMKMVLVGGTGATIASTMASTTITVMKTQPVWWFWKTAVPVTIPVLDPFTLALAIAAGTFALVVAGKGLLDAARIRGKIVEALCNAFSSRPPNGTYREGGILYQVWNGSASTGRKGIARETEENLEGLLNSSRDAFDKSIAATDEEIHRLQDAFECSDQESSERVAFFHEIREQLRHLL
jgi:hypothetical protein